MGCGPTQYKERSMKKVILLAMAAAIVVMFAALGSASAAWTKHEKAITIDVEKLELTGTEIEFFDESLGGGYQCKTTSKVDFTQGTTTGKVTTFESEGEPTNKANCKGTGTQQQCEVHKFTPEALPWVIHTQSKNALGEGTVSITTGIIKTQHTGFLCISPEITAGTVHITVPAAQINTTSTGTLSGTLKISPNDNPVRITGQVHVLGTITYGV